MAKIDLKTNDAKANEQKLSKMKDAEFEYKDKLVKIGIVKGYILTSNPEKWLKYKVN